jgi:glutaredoxin
MIKKFLTLALFLSVSFLAAGCDFKLDNLGDNPASDIKATATSSGDLILFYSQSCPHCQNVEQYMGDSKIQDKLKIEQKEISNKETANQLLEKVKACNLNIDSVGVPFLWSNGQCLVGDEDIINFFKAKIQP